MIKLSILLFLTLHVISCMPVMMLIYGLHQPRYVSDEAVTKFYHHLGLHDEIFRVKDFTEENRKKFEYLGNSMPEVLLFNSSGQLTKFGLDCSGSLDSIVKLSIQNIDSMSLNTEGKTMQDLIRDTYVVDALVNDDLTHVNVPVYVVKFAEYAGLLNKDNVPELVERLSSRDDVRYIVLNMDYTLRK